MSVGLGLVVVCGCRGSCVVVCLCSVAMSSAQEGSVVNWPGEFKSEAAREISPALISLVIAAPSCCVLFVLTGGCDCGSFGSCSCDH